MSENPPGGQRRADWHETVWPLGPKAGTGVKMARRPGSLDGVVIGEVWDHMFYGDKLFPLLRDELHRRYPRAKFVEYTNFGNIHGPSEREVVAGLPAALREKGVDAVITGVGN